MIIPRLRTVTMISLWQFRSEPRAGHGMKKTLCIEYKFGCITGTPSLSLNSEAKERCLISRAFVFLFRCHTSRVGNGKGFDFKVVNVYIFNLTKIKIPTKSYPKSSLGVQFFL